MASFREDEGFSNLGGALEAKKYDDAFDYAHMLKGVAGNLGLNPLFNTISVLVEALRAKDFSTLSAQYAAIQEEQARLSTLL